VLSLDATFRDVVRDSRPCTLGALARAAKVSRPLLSLILSGKRRASLRVARAVADALGRSARQSAQGEARLRRALERESRRG